ncbi:MAG: glycosyltransferase [Rhodospirillaceae bacterium]
MSARPFFSVVTVVRNDLAGLTRTYESLQKQGLRDFEWLVVDGCSDDGTREWLAAHDGEITWWRSAPDRGLYDAMNIGLTSSRGEYVVFLNAGDSLAASGTLKYFSTHLIAAGYPDFCYGDALEGFLDGSVLNKPARSHRVAWYGMFTHHQAMLYRRLVLTGLKYNLAYPIAADYALTLQVLERAQSSMQLREPFCLFAPGGISQRDANAGRREQACIRRDLLGHGFISCRVVSAIQWMTFSLRKIAPELFSLIRCRSALFRARFDIVSINES